MFENMPHNKKEKLAFTIITVVPTVISFVLYCMSYENGGIQYVDLSLAWQFMIIEFFIAVLSAEFIGNPLAEKIIAKTMDPKKNSDMIMIAATTAATAFVMCNWMSFVAQWLYGLIIPGVNGISVDFGVFMMNLIPNWLQTVVLNFPFALLGQLFVFQPFARTVFRKIFRRKPSLATQK